MRIIEEPFEVYGCNLLEIISASYTGNFTIKIRFSHGIQKLVDFKPFLISATHPSIRKYLDEKLFQEFKIIDGNLNWNDYDLIFPVADLFEGRIV